MVDVIIDMMKHDDFSVQHLNLKTAFTGKPAWSTPLHIVASGQAYDDRKARVMKRMLENAANPMVCDRSGGTPLHKAIGTQSHIICSLSVFVCVWVCVCACVCVCVYAQPKLFIWEGNRSLCFLFGCVGSI
jgi:hypothetical protein